MSLLSTLEVVGQVELSGAASGEPDGSAGATLDVLRRWEASGAPWRIIINAAAEPPTVEVQLLTCTGGDVVEVIRSSAPDVLSYLLGPSRADAAAR